MPAGMQTPKRTRPATPAGPRAAGPDACRCGAFCHTDARYVARCHTEMWVLLSLVNGARCQSLQRSRKVIPASRAIRSSSDGHT